MHMEVRCLVWNKGRKKYKLLLECLDRTVHKIEGLVRERRQLMKQWKIAKQSQKKGLNLLQRAKDKLATLHRAERLQKRHKKERVRANSSKDPFKFVLNFEGKIFFSIIAQRLSPYLLKNG